MVAYCCGNRISGYHCRKIYDAPAESRIKIFANVQHEVLHRQRTAQLGWAEFIQNPLADFL